MIFVPLMISNVEFEFLHDSLDGVESAHLAQACSGKDSVDNEVGGLATFSSAERFLMELKLLGVNCRICPFDRAHSFDILVFIVDYDYFVAISFLNCLHPMGM